jgi:hypothetical protein
MSGGGGGGGDAGKTEAELTLLVTTNRPPRRWDRGVWIRFALAITPTVVFAVLGIILTHTS